MTENKEKQVNLVTFLDAVGRTIIGEFSKEDDTHLYVKNPAVVNVVQQQDQGSQAMRMALQLFPLFFKEFLAAPTEGTCWKYNKNNITLSDGKLEFDWKLNIQYQQLFADAPVEAPKPAAAPAAPATNDDNVIQLFDD